MKRVRRRPATVKPAGSREDNLGKQIVTLEKQMFDHAKSLEFEEAARLRDQIEELRSQFVSF